MNIYLPDDVQVSFEDLMNVVGDVDEMLKVYLFRGWFLTELVNGGSPEPGKCPCCNKFLKKSEISKSQQT